MSILYTADFHLTTRPLDEYRWGVFPWLHKQVDNRDVKLIVIAGDLTDAKDNHPAALVNRLMAKLRALSEHCPVRVIKGNHDYADPKNPFFDFINAFESPFLRYYTEPKWEQIEGLWFLFLPHSRRPEGDWERISFKSADRIIFHQPLIGAVGEGGFKIERGFKPGFFDAHNLKKGAYVIGGDIHTPQEVGNAIYCGAPYPVHFGDDYEPRVLLEKEGELLSVRRVSIRKTTVTVRRPEQLEEKGYVKGDLIQVIVRVPRSEFYQWREIREAVLSIAKKQKWKCCSIKLEERVKAKQEEKTEGRVERLAAVRPGDVLAQYCKARKVDPEMARIGREILDET